MKAEYARECVCVCTSVSVCVYECVYANVTAFQMNFACKMLQIVKIKTIK